MRLSENAHPAPQTPEKRKGKTVHDFGWAKGDRGLQQMLSSLDRNGFELVCVTHVYADCYKVFYRRTEA